MPHHAEAQAATAASGIGGFDHCWEVWGRQGLCPAEGYQPGTETHHMVQKIDGRGITSFLQDHKKIWEQKAKNYLFHLSIYLHDIYFGAAERSQTSYARPWGMELQTKNWWWPSCKYWMPSTTTCIGASASLVTRQKLAFFGLPGRPLSTTDIGALVFLVKFDPLRKPQEWSSKSEAIGSKQATLKLVRIVEFVNDRVNLGTEKALWTVLVLTTLGTWDIRTAYKAQHFQISFHPLQMEVPSSLQRVAGTTIESLGVSLRVAVSAKLNEADVLAAHTAW